MAVGLIDHKQTSVPEKMSVEQHIFFSQGQHHICLPGPDLWTVKEARFQVGNHRPTSLGHAMSFRRKNRLSELQCDFCQKPGDEKHSLAADPTYYNLLFDHEASQ